MCSSEWIRFNLPPTLKKWSRSVNLELVAALFDTYIYIYIRCIGCAHARAPGCFFVFEQKITQGRVVACPIVLSHLLLLVLADGSRAREAQPPSQTANALDSRERQRIDANLHRLEV